ncbi:MAG: CU044_5270 family protein [Candidatus Limnocylindria bacterium]
MDDLELIRAHAPQVAAPGAERKRQARQTLMAAAVAPTRRVVWPAAPGRRTAVTALVLATLAIVVVRGPFSFLAGADPAAAAALRHAAAVAAEADPLSLGDGYLHTRTEALWGFQAAEWMYLRPLVRDFWIAADGSGRIRETVGELIFLSEADREAWEAGEFTPFALNEDFGPGGLEPQVANASLPTDVDLLRAEVKQRAAATHPWATDSQMFVVIGDLLRDPLTPPDVRAALFHVAAGLPGIELLGEMTDRIGRPGLGVAMSAYPMTPFHRQEVIIFDPATSVLLEERTVSLAPYGDTLAPFLWGYATYLETEIVPELPAQ